MIEWRAPVIFSTARRFQLSGFERVVNGRGEDARAVSGRSENNFERKTEKGVLLVPFIIRYPLLQVFVSTEAPGLCLTGDRLSVRALIGDGVK